MPSLSLMLTLALLPSIAPSQPDGGTGGPPFINEVRIDQAGNDTDEYFELIGTPSSTLDGVTYLVIGDGTGGSGTVEFTLDLTGHSLDANGRFLVAESTFSLTATPDLVASLNFENSDNVTHLLVLGNTAVSGDDLDTDDDGVLDSTPWFGALDGVALIEEPNPPTGTEFHYGGYAGVVAEVGPDGSFVPGHAYRCEHGWRIGAFTLGTNDSPGDANFCGPFTVPFCMGLPNSVSASGSRISVDSASSGSIAANDSSLVITGTPDFFGLFVQSDLEMPPAMAPFGGNICLRGNVQRLNVPIMPAGNTASLALDFAGSGPESMVIPGVVFYYQWFHRDTTPGGGNFSEGLGIAWNM